MQNESYAHTPSLVATPSAMNLSTGILKFKRRCIYISKRFPLCLTSKHTWKSTLSYRCKKKPNITDRHDRYCEQQSTKRKSDDFSRPPSDHDNVSQKVKFIRAPNPDASRKFHQSGRKIILTSHEHIYRGENSDESNTRIYWLTSSFLKECCSCIVCK